MSKKVVVVAVHPDDETLGAGGTLLKYREAGYEVSWVIVTELKESFGWSPEQIKKRTEEINIVRNMYSFNNVFQMGFKPAGLDEYSLGELVSAFSSIFNKIQPNIVILPNPTDAHSDHAVAFQAAFSCTKKFRYPSINMIMTMEVLSETDFAYPLDYQPNYYIDISETFVKKLNIMEHYESELKQHPFPRSKRALEALSVLRGAQSGVEHAESFHIIKHIEFSL